MELHDWLTELVLGHWKAEAVETNATAARMKVAFMVDFFASG